MKNTPMPCLSSSKHKFRSTVCAVGVSLLLFVGLSLLQAIQPVEIVVPPSPPETHSEPVPITPPKPLPDEPEPEPIEEVEQDERPLPNLDQIEFNGIGGVVIPGVAAPVLTDFEPPEIFEPGDLDTPPKLVSMPLPRVREEVRRSGVSGVVSIRFVLDDDGRPCRPEVIDSPHPGLAAAAVEALMKATFEPGRKGGKAVLCRVVLPVKF